VRRFHADNDLLYSYDNTIRQQLSQKVIEIVSKQINFRQYYLPHHPVLTPTKATSKLRIVYDASSKARRDLNSLNKRVFVLRICVVARFMWSTSEISSTPSCYSSCYWESFFTSGDSGV